MNLNRLDLNLLVVFDALLQEMSVTKAADRLHMSQPATSAALARLRRQLGDPILVREGRHLSATPYALSLAATVREVLARLDTAVNSSPVFDPAVDRHTFEVVASDYAALILLRPLLALLPDIAPNVHVKILPMSRLADQQLARDEVDLVIAPLEIISTDGPIVSEELFQDRYCCAVWAGNPRVGNEMTLELLSELPYLAYWSLGTTSFGETQLDRAQVPRQIEYTTPSFVVAPLLLRGTNLVTVGLERMLEYVAPTGDLKLLEVPIEMQPISEAMHWHQHRDGSPAHRWLRDQLMKVAIDM